MGGVQELYNKLGEKLEVLAQVRNHNGEGNGFGLHGYPAK
jgi:hypothetical protein